MSTPRDSSAPSASLSIPGSLGHFVPSVFALTSALYFLSDNEADNDLWVHLLTGREILATHALPTTDTWSFTSMGSAWVNHEWLSQVLFALMFNLGGDTAVWLFKVAIALTTAALLWRLVCHRSDLVWIRATVLVLTVAVMARGFAMRPQIFTYLATAILLAWLDHRDAQRRTSVRVGEIVGIAALFGFWANVHGGFVFGLGVLGLYQLSLPLNGWLARAALLITAVLATCANPHGASLLTYLAHELQTAHPITEWQAVAPGDPALLTYFVLLGTLLITIPFTTLLRQRPWYAALMIATIAMSMRHQRHAPLLALCGAAPLADQLQGALAWVRQRTAFVLSTASLRLIGFAVAVLVVLQIAFVGARLVNDGPHIVYEATDYPVGAVRYLTREGLRGNIAVPLDWGAYVLWHGNPNLRVSLDGRFATVYPPKAVEANFAFYGDGPIADRTRLIDEYGATLVLAPVGWRTPAHERTGWQVRYRDDVAELLVAGPAAVATTEHAPTGRLRFP